MEILGQTRFLERLQFFNGQRLFASDLQGVEAFNREMRWLHNQSLHQAGIGSGFAVIGKKGDREVTIMPGYAIDAQGREMVLTESWVQQIPPVAGEDDGTPVFFDLTVSYPADTDLEEAETREGICLPRGVVRLREQPIFCWVRLDGNGQPVDARLKREVLAGMKIVLSRAEVLNCQLNRDLSIAQRRSARPAKQPHIACGTALPTEWQIWDFRKEAFSSAALRSTDLPIRDFTLRASQVLQTEEPFIAEVGLQAVISTAAAGFVTTPCYSAHIVGPRIKQVGSMPVLREFIVDSLVNVVEPQPRSFMVRVLLLVQALSSPGEITNLKPQMQSVEARHTESAAKVDAEQDPLALFSDWYVVWMGVEG